MIDVLEREPTAAAGRLRVLVADDHPLVRLGVSEFLRREPDMEVVGCAINGEEAVAMSGRLHPDVVVMDVTMPRMGGVEATRRVRSCCPGVTVVGLSMHEGDAMLPVMLAAGAAAYVEKTEPLEDLAAVIRSACGRG